MIELRLDARSGLPAYLQIVQQVKHALRLGLLARRPDADDPRAGRVAGDQPEHGDEGLSGARDGGVDRGRPGQGTFVLESLTGSSHGRPGRNEDQPESMVDASRGAGNG